MRKFGFSFSWKRALGLSSAKGKLSRLMGIPLTKSGRQRKGRSRMLAQLLQGCDRLALFGIAQSVIAFVLDEIHQAAGVMEGAALDLVRSRRFGRFFFLPPKRLEEAERWLARYEAGGVFFARLLPGVRHLISIPAGIVRMKFSTFSYVTVAGSAISCAILAFVGERAHAAEPELLSDPEGLVRFVRGQSRAPMVWALFGTAEAPFDSPAGRSGQAHS